MSQIILKTELIGLPPSVNHIYSSSRSSARFLTKEAKEFRDYALGLIRPFFYGKFPFTGRASVEIVFATNNKRRWDIDNRVKFLLDCIVKGGALKDDSIIDYLCVSRVYGSPIKTFITVSALSTTP